MKPSDTSDGSNDLSEAQARLLQQRATHLQNERKYLAWVRTSIALLTLGFVVERFDLFLYYIRKETGENPPPVPEYLTWLTVGFFVLAGVMIVTATWDFFSERRRIQRVQAGSSVTLDIVILITLTVGVLITIAFLLPRYP